MVTGEEATDARNAAKETLAAEQEKLRCAISLLPSLAFLSVLLRFSLISLVLSCFFDLSHRAAHELERVRLREEKDEALELHARTQQATTDMWREKANALVAEMHEMKVAASVGACGRATWQIVASFFCRELLRALFFCVVPRSLCVCSDACEWLWVAEMTRVHTEVAEQQGAHAAELRVSAEAASADREAAAAQHQQELLALRHEHAAEVVAMQEAAADQVRCFRNPVLACLTRCA